MSIFAGIIHTLAVLAPVASVAFTIWGRNARTISEVQETAQVFSGMGQQLP